MLKQIGCRLSYILVEFYLIFLLEIILHSLKTIGCTSSIKFEVCLGSVFEWDRYFHPFGFNFLINGDLPFCFDVNLSTNQFSLPDLPRLIIFQNTFWMSGEDKLKIFLLTFNISHLLLASNYFFRLDGHSWEWIIIINFKSMGTTWLIKSYDSAIFI